VLAYPDKSLEVSGAILAGAEENEGRRLGALEPTRTVIAPPTDAEGGLFSEINDNSVAILLTYGTARILLAGDAEANEEEYMANGPYTGPLTMVRVSKYKMVL
jgi:beta-lactamase superfamily II metal-dependent hydrolase